jgi:hypothetical protein
MFDRSLLAGVIASILGIAGLIPYLRDIFLRKTKPERAMWWIYTALFALLFFAQVSAGAHYLLIVTATYVLSSTVIAILSVKYGYGSFHLRDGLSLAVAAIGLVLWRLTNNPLIAILMVIIVDFAGFWLTLLKAWHAPHSETLIFWELTLTATVFSVFSAGSWKLSIIIYPIYAVIADVLLVCLIIYRRRMVKEDPSDF